MELTGAERIDLSGLSAGFSPGMAVTATIHRPNGSTSVVTLRARIDTRREAEWVRHGGILPFVTRALFAAHPEAASTP